VLQLAKLGVDALTVDADAFILRDAWQYIKRYPHADVLMSSDMLYATLGYNHTGLESQRGFGPDFNIGYIFIRHTAVDFVQSWRDACFRSPTAWDQHLFAQTLRRGGQGQITPKNLLPMFRAKDGHRLLAGVLPVGLFASGHTFFVTRMAHQMRRQPFMVHTTFQYGGTEGKRHRLREGMMWEDDEAYYSADFLSYTPDIPYSYVYPSGNATVRADGSVRFEHRMSVAQHFRLVHHQLAQIRNALALAQSLAASSFSRGSSAASIGTGRPIKASSPARRPRCRCSSARPTTSSTSSTSTAGSQSPSSGSTPSSATRA